MESCILFYCLHREIRMETSGLFVPLFVFYYAINYLAEKNWKVLDPDLNAF